MIETEIKKIELIERKELLPKTTQNAQVLPPTATYYHTLPNIKQIIQKSKNQAADLKANVLFVNLEYSHCILHTLIVQPTKWTDTSNCKSDFVFYLLECKKCYIQYVGKTETDFDLRLNNHCKDLYKADAIPARRHFLVKYHIFNREASFIIIEKIRKNT